MKRLSVTSLIISLLLACGGDSTGPGDGGEGGNGDDTVIGSYVGSWQLDLAGHEIEHPGVIKILTQSESDFTGEFQITVGDETRTGTLSGTIASNGQIAARLGGSEAAFASLTDCTPVQGQALELVGQRASDDISLQVNASVSQCDAIIFISRAIAPGITGVQQNTPVDLNFSGRKDRPAPSGLEPPILSSPAVGAQIFQNDQSIGCPPHPNRGSGFRLFFDWSEAGTSVLGYDLHVMHRGSSLPLIDVFVSGSDYADLACNAFVTDFNRTEWTWRVRTVGANQARSAWSPENQFEFAPCRLAGGTPCTAPPPVAPQDPDPSASFPLWFLIVDPVADHTGSIDVVSMLVNFDDGSGDYEIVLQADAANPFVGSFRVNINLFDPDVGTTAPFPAFFQDAVNDFSLGETAQTQLRLTGSDPALTNWGAGDRVFTNSLAGTGNPDGSSLFRSSVVDPAGGFLTNEDVIAFADLSQPAAVQQR